ncbi:MAG: hypothetical protein JRD02_07360 [Deltaproteobacteria bacterium]|nr:hypothetical protein [Deltaproteobacteria bacterium]
MSIIDRLKGYKKIRGTVFHSEQEINNSTLLINAKIYTHSLLLRVLLLNRVLPVGKRIGMKIYFKNLYEEKIPKIQNLPYFINYPNTLPDTEPARNWYFDMPELGNKDDGYYEKVPKLFLPEVPGNHILIIPRVSGGVQYAGYHGLAGRKYKIMAGHWTQNFYVSDSMEVRNSILVSFAVIASIITLFVSIISLIISLMTKM